MWIIFEGMDKTGKTTLIKELGKQTNYKDILIDRGPAGYKFYDYIYGRLNDFYNNKWEKKAKQIMNYNNFEDEDLKVLIIHLETNEETFIRRLKEANENEPTNKMSLSFEGQNLLYKDICLKLYGEENILNIDTSKMSINESIRLIKEMLGYIYLSD